MSARFPVSATAVDYQIKAAWSSKIKAIFWPAGADSLHMLRPGDTTTTLVTRSASGATYNSTEGRIEGTANAPFAVEVSGGLGVNEDTAGLCFGASVYGDAFNFAPANGVCTVLGSADANPADDSNGLGVYAQSYGLGARVQNNPSYDITAPMANDVASLVGYAIRHDQADGTAKFRAWVSENGATGTETTGFRQNPIAPNSSTVIGGTGRPLHVGQTKTVSGNTKIDFESAWLAVSLSDSDLATISTNPADVIEAASAPAAELAGTATASVTATGDLTTTPAVKGVSIQLGDGTPAANLTGLSVRWWDAEAPTGAPDYESDVETTDATGWLEIDLSAVTALAVGANGYLHVFKAGATPADDIVAAGRVPVSDIA